MTRDVGSQKVLMVWATVSAEIINTLSWKLGKPKFFSRRVEKALRGVSKEDSGN